MSIEKALADLTAALVANTIALNGGAQSPVTNADVGAVAKRGPGRPSKVETGASQPVAAPAVSFAQVADALSELVNAGGRDQGIALLAKYGAPKASVLKPDQFAAFLADVKALSNKAPPVAAQPTSLI